MSKKLFSKWIRPDLVEGEQAIRGSFKWRKSITSSRKRAILGISSLSTLFFRGNGQRREYHDPSELKD
jgi:hypothetical protein